MTGTRSRGATKWSRRRADSGSAAKRRFPFGVALRRIRAYLRDSGRADAAMFELAERGHRSVFEQLVGCIISIRTLDEVSLPTALALFERADTPQALAKLSVAQIDALIHASAFHGVGPKCANLALGVACGRAAIGVDVHVHRVTNRWGVVAARTPEQTMTA